MAGKNEEVVLDFSTKKPERPIIKIDGHDYHLAIPDDFVFAEYLWIAQEGAKFSDLLSAENADEELEQQIDRLAKKALYDVPDDVFERLNTSQKMQVMNLFSEAVVGIAGALRRAIPKKRSPESKGSTVGQ